MTLIIALKHHNMEDLPEGVGRCVWGLGRRFCLATGYNSGCGLHRSFSIRINMFAAQAVFLLGNTPARNRGKGMGFDSG